MQTELFVAAVASAVTWSAIYAIVMWFAAPWLIGATLRILSTCLAALAGVVAPALIFCHAIFVLDHGYVGVAVATLGSGGHDCVHFLCRSRGQRASIETRQPPKSDRSGSGKNPGRSAIGRNCSQSRAILAESNSGLRLVLKPVRQFALAFHRARDAQAFAVLRDGAAGDVDTAFHQDFDDAVVGEDVLRGFVIDQALDLVPHRFGGMRLAAVGGVD